MTMDILAGINIWDLFVNLKQFMDQVIQQYHSWVYLLLFVMIFCETGLVVTPFLPGDSLLFIAGSFAVSGGDQAPLQLSILLPVLCLAPVLGDSTNYWLGRYIGPKIFHREKVRFLNRDHLDRAHRFYEKHGGKAVAIGRFLPIIRTFVPFVAGIGRMNYGRFVTFSVVGTLAWIHLCVLAGYFFGQRPFVQKHFEIVIVAIIVISLLPAFFGYLSARRETRAKVKAQAQAEAETKAS